jgi:exosome complex exonuclease DIS3/RRP44
MSSDIAVGLKAALSDPSVLELIANVVSTKLQGEFAQLKKQLAEKDEKIRSLEDKVDELEQYSRRNNVRISGVPETVGEDTDALVIQLAKAIGCDLQPGEIDRSHRVGPKDLSKGPRPLLVKMMAYRSKRALTSRRSGLKSKSGKVIFPDLKWANDAGRVFINDDLTSTRSRVAAEARSRKKQGSIKDTWVFDGVIFVRKNNDNVYRVTCMRQLLTL